MKIEHAKYIGWSLVCTYFVYYHTHYILYASSGALAHYAYSNRDKIKNIYKECVFTWHEMNPQHPKGVWAYRVLEK